MVTKSLENDPLAITSLVRASSVYYAKSGIEHFLPQLDFDEAQLRLLQSALRDADQEKILVNVIVGERALSIEATQNILEASPVPLLDVWQMTSEQAIRFLNAYDQLIDAAGQDWPTGWQLAKQVSKDRNAGKCWAKIEHVYPNVAVTLPTSMWRFFEANGRMLVQCRTADVGIAAELFRRKNDRYPQSLEELVPDYIDSIPRDPFDYGPLRYRVDDRGCVVYSLGPDGVDHLGITDNEITALYIFRLPHRPKTHDSN
jgi:hypothetical protein